VDKIVGKKVKMGMPNLSKRKQIKEGTNLYIKKTEGDEYWSREQMTDLAVQGSL
jgi:hypothetical protein